jgi:hypothetical protein
MGILSKILGTDKKKSTTKKCSSKKTTTTKSVSKKIPASVKDKYFITDITPTDKANTKANAKKKQVRLNLCKKVYQAIENAKSRKPESKLGRLEKIFTIDEENKTIATIRYGSVIFYQGVMNEANVFDRHGKENFENKLGALNHLKMMLEADEWFDPQYEKYLTIKELADKRSATTKKANKSKASSKKTATKAIATKASAKKSTTKKTSAKKVSAKASVKARSTKASSSKSSAKKASGKTIKKK